jgi:hypothetical protein
VVKGVGKGVAVGTGVGDEIGVGGGSGPFICFLQLEIKTAKIITATAMIPVEIFFIKETSLTELK